MTDCYVRKKFLLLSVEYNTTALNFDNGLAPSTKCKCSFKFISLDNNVAVNEFAKRIFLAFF
jgi:hypothetical protein